MHTWKKSADHQPTPDDTRQKICMCRLWFQFSKSCLIVKQYFPVFPSNQLSLEHFHRQKRRRLFRGFFVHCVWVSTRTNRLVWTFLWEPSNYLQTCEDYRRKEITFALRLYPRRKCQKWSQVSNFRIFSEQNKIKSQFWRENSNWTWSVASKLYFLAKILIFHNVLEYVFI